MAGPPLRLLHAAPVLLALACAPERKAPPAAEACDADCRVARAVDAARRSPEALEKTLAALPSREEQHLAARALLEAGAVKDRSLCDLFEDAATQRYCAGLAQRPHLFEDPRPRAAQRRREAGGPPDAELVAEGPAPAWAARPTPTTPDACSPAEVPAACAHRAAVEAARRAPGLRDSAALCAGIASPMLADECRFASAEEALRTHGAAAAPDAFPLCVASERFAAHCLAHGVSALAAAAPAATAPVAAWAPVRAAGDAVRGSLAPIDARLAASAERRLYSEAAVTAYEAAPHLDGRSFDALPAAAARAIRDGLAWELLARGEIPADASLEAAVAALAAAEARRLPASTTRTPPTRRAPVRDQVGADRGGALQFEMGWWRGPARRPVSADEATDRALSLLEAARALGGPQAPLLHHALPPDAPDAVRWSVARLSGRPEAWSSGAPTVARR